MIIVEWPTIYTIKYDDYIWIAWNNSYELSVSYIDERYSRPISNDKLSFIMKKLIVKTLICNSSLFV